jgi:hypothetical protein
MEIRSPALDPPSPAGRGTTIERAEGDPAPGDSLMWTRMISGSTVPRARDQGSMCFSSASALMYSVKCLTPVSRHF